MKNRLPILLRVLLIAVFGIMFLLLSGILPLAQFDREFIDIEIFPNRILVNGLYVYRNPFPFPVVQGLSIPLPIDARHPIPVALDVDLMSPAPRHMPVRFFWGQYRMDLRIPANSEETIRVQYEQYSPSCDARYILTTTAAWKRPLSRGVYRLLLNGVRMENSNYGVEPDGAGTMKFERINFQPPTDWLFTWRSL